LQNIVLHDLSSAMYAVFPSQVFVKLIPIHSLPGGFEEHLYLSVSLCTQP